VVTGKGGVVKGGREQAAGGGKKNVRREEERKIEQQRTAFVHKQQQVYVLVFNTSLEDRKWASGGMVASVINGDSALSWQQRVEDAGFQHVVVIPLGGDRVFLHCSDGGDIWQVFNNALHFFRNVVYIYS